ncbi:hypothetical protein N8203_03340 [Crocinitomicaceae bacterium]|nr:hypothetical protein [Crocinitomicaceae bacterium]MDC3309005.1 hypothetical protein [Crocinitomicaceae bacterium]
MKKSLLISILFVACMSTIGKAQDVIQLHVKKIRTQVLKNDSLKYTYNQDVNTVYHFDLKNQLMSVDFPTKKDVHEKTISVKKSDDKIFINCSDTDAWNLVDIKVEFEIDQENNIVVLRDRYQYSNEKTKEGEPVVTTSVTEFLEFDISNTN